MAAAVALTGHLVDIREMFAKDTPIQVMSADASSSDLPAPIVLPDDPDKETMLEDEPGLSAAASKHGVPTGGEASLNKFVSLKGIAAPMDRSNVDTDLIIPARSVRCPDMGDSLLTISYSPQLLENDQADWPWSRSVLSNSIRVRRQDREV